MNHIKHIHDDNISWCEETLGNEFYFKSIDHAVLNGMSKQTKLTTCNKCTAIVVEHLIMGSILEEIHNES